MNLSMYFASVTILIMCCHPSSALISWLFGKSKNSRESRGRDGKTSSNDEEMPKTEIKENVPFEMTTVDDKFQLETQFIQHLSPLDACHHRTIAAISSACGDMSEEELGKLSVRLLNCQLKAELRPVYQCTSEMSLAECTQSMDGTVWNAYQIVSNRARAVCYAARQQHFRVKTEMTVNALIDTTEHQLHTMQHIQGTQEELRSATKETLDEVKEGQERLTASQAELQQTHSHLHAHLTSNIQALRTEKSLIASGNKQLAEMTQAIKLKLDATSDQLSDQEEKQKLSHQMILDDIATIRDRAQEVWSKLDESSERVVQFHTETRGHYEETLDNLARINATVASVAGLLTALTAQVDHKLSWLAAMVGTTGDHVSMLWTLALHVLYLLTAAIAASFLHTPLFSRLLILLLVPLNAIIMLQGRQPSLGFLPMTLFIFLTVIANWALRCTYAVWSWYRHTPSKSLPHAPPPLAIARPHDDSSDDLLHSPPPSLSRSVISTPDIKKLASLLEKVYHSGVISTNNHSLRRTSSLGSLSDCGSPDRSDRDETESLTPEDIHPPHPSPTPDNEESFTPYSPSVELVRRDLLHVMDSDPRMTPTAHRTPLTPRSTPRGPPTPRGSPALSVAGSTTSSTRSRRSTSLNRSMNRPLCLSTTKAGRACRLSSVEGSDFCHLHQVS